MQRTSRTPRATRVASALCSEVPSSPAPTALLCLGLLFGAALAALWLLGGAPAHADTGRDAAHPLGSAALDGSAAPEGSAPLDDVVPGEVAEPVRTTLGTVHQRLRTGADRDTGSGAALAEAARPVADVGTGVLGAVGETEHALPDAPNLGSVPALPLDEPPRSDDAPGVPAAGKTGDGAAGHEPAAGDRERPERADAPKPRGPVGPAAPGRTPSGHASAADPGGDHHDADPAPRPPEPPVAQPAAGSAATAGSSPAAAPGIAGYLTSAHVPPPASDAVGRAPRHHRAVPAAGADDPTVSPD
jgi:hypothetical protein